MRVSNQHGLPNAASVVRDAEQCAECISIPGAPGLKVIAGGEQSTFDMTFDGSPEAIARAPLNMDKLECVLEKVRSGRNTELNAEDTNVLEHSSLLARKRQSQKKSSF